MKFLTDSKKGFTLTETMVTIAVFALAMGAASMLIIKGYELYSYTLQQSQAIKEARRGIEILVKEIREAKKGEDGSFVIEKAGDYEFIFYSDIDKDREIERVRYFIKPAGGGSGSQIDECASFSSGGSCTFSISDFLSGDLESAQVNVSAEGDLNSNSENIDIYADGVKLGTLCTGSDCGQCVGAFQDTTNFDVSDQARDNSIQFAADASNSVNPFCDWKETNHSFIAKFEFNWSEQAEAGAESVFKKGIIQPTVWPVSYSSGDEEIKIISNHIQNEERGKPVFNYYDQDNNLLPLGERISKTTLMQLNLIININPDRKPKDFILESSTQLRNLKTNL